jgi:hypothetical protein
VQGAVGYTAFNVMDTKISYIDDEQSDPVYAHLSWGYALSGNVLADKLLADYVRPEYIFCRNLFSFRYLNGSVDNKYDSTITGIGTELGFFDTFFLRNGRYDDPDGSIVGKTHGWGLNLHYKDVISYNYNYAVFAGGDLMPEQDSYDHNVSLNLLLLSRLISGK